MQTGNTASTHPRDPRCHRQSARGQPETGGGVHSGGETMAANLTLKQDAHRWSLYRAGLTDKEIAQAEGVTVEAIRCWRRVRGLRPNKKKPKRTIPPEWYRKRSSLAGVPMETVLPPEGCRLVRAFLRALVAYRRMLGKSVDVGKFMHAWRDLNQVSG